MIKLKNVSGVPIAFDGVKGTVRFLKGQSKTFNEKEITPSLEEGIKNGSLASEQIEGEDKLDVLPKRSAKKNKEV